MDDLTFLDASLIYSLLFSPLLTMILVLFWTSANMKKTAKAQLLGIVTLLVLGIVAINSPLILLMVPTAIVLLVVWLFAYRKFFLKGQFTTLLLLLVLQVSFYLLFFVIMGSEGNLALTLVLLGIIPLLSMILLYPWTFGQKKTTKGHVFLIIVFIVQVIAIILSITLSIMAMSNL